MNPRNQCGFSLVEVVIALTLTSVVTTMLASSWYLLLRLNDRMQDDTWRSTGLQERLRIQRILGSAVSVDFFSDTPEFELVTGPDTITLTAWVNPGGFDIPDADTDPCRVELHTGTSAGLVIRLLPDFFEMSPGNRQNADFTWRGLEQQGRCRIDVLGCDGRWHKNWPAPEQQGLPQSVRLRFDGAGIPAFADIVVRLPAAGECS
jgi:prepilin-type N-terminal cleavage/methylation domain-containing protein